MSAGRFIPGSFRREVREQLGRLLAHPGPRVRPEDTVLGVLEPDAGRRRRVGHRRHRTAALAAGALAVSMGALGAGVPSAAGSADDKTTFTVALINEADSLNPFLGILAESYDMWALTYDYMIHWSMKDMAPEPGLAESWDTSKDGLTWTFHIRTGVKWSDGEPLTAADIAYTYGRILDGGPEATTWGSYLNAVETATAPDAETVVLKLSRPNAVLPLLPIPIVPEHIWKDVSEKEMKSYPAEPQDGKPVVGSGPFRFVEGTAGGSTYRFEANPDYWAGAPHVDEVVFRVFKSTDPAVQALVKGDVDFAFEITALQVKSLQSVEGVTAHNGNSPGYEEIAFNTGSVDLKTGDPMGNPNPALLDPKFRHALGYAVDTKRIISTAYQGAGLPGSTIVPQAYPDFHWEPTGDEAYTFDLDKAGQLLDDAGYKKGADGLRAMPDGDPIGTLLLYGRTESPSSIDTMDFFKEWLGELGIDAEVKAVEDNQLTGIILDGKFDAFAWGWFVEPDPDTMLSYMTCGQRGNWSDSWYCNPEYDKLYEAQSSELDRAKRIEMVKKMQQIIYQDAPYIVITYDTYGEAARTDRFACFQPQPDPGGIWIQQYGAHNYLSVRPAAEAGDCDGVATAVRATASSASSDSGSSTGMLVGGGVAAVALLAAGGFLMMRRRATASDRE